MKLNRSEFIKYRENIKVKQPEETVILVGLGSCGIAAGAGKTFEAFQDEISSKNLSGITVKQTGCMGLCETEPTVEVRVPGMPDIIYGKVTPEIARKIIEKHVIRKILVNNLIQDKPSSDIMKKGEIDNAV
ncbi:MAG: (2Fe-2S) ferredoxin domain-containing protein [Spirochaetes bacterium]|nr:(2Fe-2S) ferredoxin domain-containing protein [Spirochaetota bacterium]